MPTVTTHTPFDMRTASVFVFGDIVARDETQFTMSDGARATRYVGNFTYDGASVFGRITNSHTSVGGVAQVSVTEMSEGAFAFLDRMATGRQDFVYDLVFSGDDNLLGSDRGDTLTGAGGHDTLRGLGGDDMLFGSAGDDDLHGDDGDDTLDGGSGFNRYFEGSGNDLFIGTSGEDRVIFRYESFSYSVATDGDYLSVAGPYSIVRLTHIETLEFQHGGQIKVTTGTGGDDILHAQSPAATGYAYVIGLDGADRIFGGDAIDNLAGGDGDDRIDGLGAGDILDGGAGADTLIGGDGDDRIFGGSVPGDLNDTIFAGAGADRAEGGAGNDLIFGMDGADTLIGGTGADDLRGQNGGDILNGSGGSDAIFGGSGNDFFNGGFGHDRLNGGSGADRFFHTGDAGHGSDWVQDYTAGDGDSLVFAAASAVRTDFAMTFAHATAPDGERAGDDALAEAFVTYRPTGQILWALVDGEGQEAVNLRIGDDLFDLLG